LLGAIGAKLLGTSGANVLGLVCTGMRGTGFAGGMAGVCPLRAIGMSVIDMPCCNIRAIISSLDVSGARG
jgi:hypothetical protein